jgi:hypothetical protein
MNFLTVGATIFKFLPKIVEAVQEVEHLDSSPGKGAAKLQLAISLLRVAYKDFTKDQTAIPFDNLVEDLKSVIAGVVEFYNTLGTFKKALQKQAA